MVEETYVPLTLSAPSMSDREFQDLCDQYSDYLIEYSADGEITIMPPTDPETSARNATITMRLALWAKVTQLGIVTDSSGAYLLPNQARRAPDSAWITRERLRLRPSCPEFVIELLSPTDRRKKIHEKMLEWIANGAELGWMIDPYRRSVSIYRKGQEVEVRTGITQIEGEGPIAGFVLDLREIWDV